MTCKIFFLRVYVYFKQLFFVTVCNLCLLIVNQDFEKKKKFYVNVKCIEQLMNNNNLK